MGYYDGDTYTPAERRKIYQRIQKKLARFDRMKHPNCWEHEPYICMHIEDEVDAFWINEKKRLELFPELALMRPKGAKEGEPWWYDGKVYDKTGEYDYSGRADYASRIVALQLMIELTHDAKE